MKKIYNSLFPYFQIINIIVILFFSNDCYGLDHWSAQPRFNSNYFDMSSDGKMFYYIEENYGDLPVLHMEHIEKTLSMDSINFDSSKVVCFKLSPDKNHFIIGFSNGNLELWNIAEKSVEKTFISYPAPNSNKQIRFSDTGDEFTELYCLNPIMMRRWKIDTGEILSEFNVSENFYENYFYLSNNGEFVIIKSIMDSLKAWNVKTKELIYSNHSQIPETIINNAISDNGNFVSYSNNVGEIKIFDINKQQYLKTLQGDNRIHYSLQILKNKYVFFDTDSNLVFYDFENDLIKNYKNVIGDNTRELSLIIFSDDLNIISIYKGRNLGCPNDMPAFDEIIEIYNLNEEKLLKRFSDGHIESINWIGFSGDGNVVCTKDASGLMYIWDSQSGKVLKMLNDVPFFRLSPKGDFLFSVRKDSIVKFDYINETITDTWINIKGPISSVLVNNKDILVVCESADSLFFVKYPDGIVESTIPRERSSQFYFVMNRNWTEVTLFYKDLNIYKYNFKTGNLISKNLIDSAFIKLPIESISQDGNYVAIKVPYYWLSGGIKVWDVNAEKYIFDTGGGYFTWAIFSQDSKKLWMHTVDPVLYEHSSKVYNLETQKYSCPNRGGMTESYMPELAPPFVSSPDGIHAIQGGCSGNISYFRLCDDFISDVDDDNQNKLSLSSNNFVAYPNPVDETITISFYQYKYGNIKICIYNQLGSEIAVLKDYPEEQGKYNFQFSIENLQLSQGLYYLKLQVGNELQTKKIIIIK